VWAETVIRRAGLGNEIAERVSRSILATRHELEAKDRDARLVTDVDLSILGRAPDVFWPYEENIRKEYARVLEDLYRQKRAEILRGFLDRDYIYYHDEYRHMFEDRARMNLKEAIAKLCEA
jgi:predicted metal-dependent HD superfamily phosphohydrolase